jgi:hypothetical protein
VKIFKGSIIGTKLTNTANGINKYLPIFEKFILVLKNITQY